MRFSCPTVIPPHDTATAVPTFDSLINNPAQFALLGLAALFVGLSKGGLPAIAMLSVPILSLFMSPLIAAILLLPIYILSDAVGVWLYRHEYSARNLKILVPAALLGVAIGWATATVVSENIVALSIGILGISFCLYTWFFKKSATPARKATLTGGIFWGSLSGFTSFVSHAGAPPFQIYVLPQKLPKMVFAGTTTLLFAAVNLAKILPYSNLHPYTGSTLKVSACLLPIAAIGTVLGRHLIQRLPEKWFFFFVQLALFLISIKLVFDVATDGLL